MAPPTEATDEEKAWARCLRLLAVRARSQAELQERLRAARFEEAVVEAVLSRLAQAGMLDDEEFARAWIASRRESGRSGKRKLRWELRRKGVSGDLIRRLVDEGIDQQSEVEQALTLARRRLCADTDDADLARVQRLLVSRGFEFDVVQAVMRRIVSEREHS